MYKKFIKRIFDFLLAFFLIISISPILLIISIFVRFKLGKPIFFSQTRPGNMAVPFKMFKFRSMTNETNSAGELLSNEERLTKFGKMIRAFSLDELPELWNVLKGEMSFVGPRPALFNQDDIKAFSQKTSQSFSTEYVSSIETAKICWLTMNLFDYCFYDGWIIILIHLDSDFAGKFF